MRHNGPWGIQSHRTEGVWLLDSSALGHSPINVDLGLEEGKRGIGDIQLWLMHTAQSPLPLNPSMTSQPSPPPKPLKRGRVSKKLFPPSPIAPFDTKDHNNSGAAAVALLPFIHVFNVLKIQWLVWCTACSSSGWLGKALENSSFAATSSKGTGSASLPPPPGLGSNLVLDELADDCATSGNGGFVVALHVFWRCSRQTVGEKRVPVLCSCVSQQKKSPDTFVHGICLGTFYPLFWVA